MQEKIEDIKYIQNAVWMMYKAFLSDHDMREYNRKAQELTRQYHEKGDKQLLNFCQNIIIAWCPLINVFGEEFNNSNS